MKRNETTEPLVETQPDLQFHETVQPCLQRLRQQGVPLIAFGQTVFWDEPVKALLCIALRRYAPELQIIAGVHDADYFSKTHGPIPRRHRFEILGHDMGATHELWAAIGEASALFGGEMPIERAALTIAGVPIHRLAAQHPEGRGAFFREYTQAFGWRGIACTSGGDMVARDVDIQEVNNTLLELIRWALDESVRFLADPSARERADFLLSEIETTAERILEQNPGASLSELYKALLVRFAEILLQQPPCLLVVTSSVEYFRFNRETCSLPRFDVLDRYLDPETAPRWRAAYDRVVAGTGIYTLDKFGEGAIPFDLVLPMRGRGTLRVLGPRLIVELPKGASESRLDRPIQSRHDLAEAIEQQFGTAGTLVGKAVALPTMFCREGAMLLHEGASGYVRLTQRMVRELADTGETLQLHPIVRLHHATWDSLAGVQQKFRLPPHLAAAFGKPVVTADEFARRWRRAMGEAMALLWQLELARKPEEVAEILGRRSEAVREHRTAYLQARQRCRRLGARIQALRDRHAALLREVRRLRRQGPAGRAEAQQRMSECAQLRAQIRSIMQSQDYRSARKARDDAVRAIQLARLRAVRDAYYVLVLDHANHRPSWWWFPLVDPTGRWFRQAATRAELYIEEMSG